MTFYILNRWKAPKAQNCVSLLAQFNPKVSGLRQRRQNLLSRAVLVCLHECGSLVVPRGARWSRWILLRVGNFHQRRIRDGNAELVVWLSPDDVLPASLVHHHRWSSASEIHQVSHEIPRSGLIYQGRHGSSSFEQKSAIRGSACGRSSPRNLLHNPKWLFHVVCCTNARLGTFSLLLSLLSSTLDDLRSRL
jgi:hypothetical protein